MLNLLVGEAVRRFYFDRLIFVRALLQRRNAENSVRIDQELHFDSRHACDHRRNILEVELGETPAVLHEFAFALKDMDLDVGLAVNERGEHFGRRCRNGRVPWNDLRHHGAHRLDPERKRRDIQQQHIALASGENVGLHGSA